MPLAINDDALLKSSALPEYFIETHQTSSNEQKWTEKRRDKAAFGGFIVSSILVIVAATLLVYSFVNLELESEIELNLKDGGSGAKSSLKNGTRLVFMIIDAFRLSFLKSDDSPMRFIRESINNRNAISFDAYARMPTVTLPRISSYITGTLPSFGTILTNLATDEIKQDNWVTRLKSEGKKIHFFGDDTWIRLLPNQFDRFDGVTSFFVNDFTEVDQNVTRHLENELVDDWDVMILHYLGLDHIGHSLGGTSPKIKEKLEEMDGIVEKVVKGLKETSSETWIIVCGDHGMTQAGSHGGSSNDETRVPVVIWNSDVDHVNEAPVDEWDKIEQIDVSATIFSIFGMKWPAQSYGISLLPKIGAYFGKKLKFDLKEQWDHFWELAKKKRVSDIFTLSCNDDQECDFDKKFVRETAEADLRSVQRKLIETSASMPNLQLGFAVFLLILAAGISMKSSKLLRHDFFLLLVNSICFASSLIEEEHEIWYFISSTCLCIKLAMVYSCKNKSMRDLILVAVLHRVGHGWMQGSRRRWSMDQSLLPAPIFEDFLDIKVKDANTILTDFPLANLLLSSFVWMFLSKDRTAYLTGFALVSHHLRFFGFVKFDAYYLLVLRFLIIPTIAICLKHPPAAFLSLVLVVTPPSQLILVASVYWIGLKSRNLEVTGISNVLNMSLLLSAFYYTGNSNSLSTLSLTSAYVGLLDYYPLLVGAQLFLSTFSGPIAFLCGYFSGEKRANDSFVQLFFIYRIIAFATSLLCLYIFQHHLFVWSVYSPKVTYDLIQSIFAIIIVIPMFLFRIGD